MDDKVFWNFCVFMYDFWHNLEYKSYKHIADCISEDIKDNESILEIACGTGILTQEITKRYSSLDYTAIDYAQNMLDICYKKRISAKFELRDATNLSYPDNNFDRIIIANALHIMPDPTSVINEAKRCLKDSGIIYAPNFLTPSTFKEKFILDIIRKFGYNVHNEFTVDSYISFLLQNGLIVNRQEIYTCFRTLLFTACSKQDVMKLIRK